MSRPLNRAVVFILVSLLGSLFLPPAGADAEYWPAEEWRTSTPEEQGIDSEMLLKMFGAVKKLSIDVHSILIVRHGYLVTEAYLHPYDKDEGHNLKSVSKSILSALAGIALREKVLSSLDQRLADFFPEYLPPDGDPRKKEITLRHLLTMTAGLEWQNNSAISARLWHSPNWVRHAMGMPMTDTPGARFNYSTALTHLMSAILTKSSGMSTEDFANKHLFAPLGIGVKRWTRDPQGYNFGGSELYLTPRDLVKFGYLYLHGGRWNGRQVVPVEWVAESVKPHVIDSSMAWAGYTGYGYWWWITKTGYEARGWGGQYIIVDPALDMVTVLTSEDFTQPRELYDLFVTPAVKSSEPLPPNPEAVGALRSLLAELAQPKPQPATGLPDTARGISGKSYDLEPNVLGLISLSLQFSGNDECHLLLRGPGGETKFMVGLDGLYRVNDVGGHEEAFRGRWETESSFLLEWHTVGEPKTLVARLTFARKTVEISAKYKLGPESEWIGGKQAGP